MSVETVNFGGIIANNITFSYEKNNATLKDVCLNVGNSEILGIIGPNGSGKTTLIKCLNKILEPLQGEILLNGKNLEGMKQAKIAKEISYVPQNSKNDMVSPNVYDVVKMGRRPHVSWNYTEKDEHLVWKAMEDLDVAQLASNSFDALSSGQTQRVLIARAIAQEAKILLLDEPTSNLDIRYQYEVMNMVQEIVKSRCVSACIIVHDLDLALKYCDRLILMCGGESLKIGTAEEVLTPELVKEAYGIDISVEYIKGRKRVIVL